MRPVLTALVLLFAILLGVAVGIVVTYVILRIQNVRVSLLSICRVLFRRQANPTHPVGVSRASPKMTPSPVHSNQGLRTSSLAAGPWVSASGVERRGPDGFLRLLAECEHNRKTAREFSGNNLSPLQTDVWDSSASLIRSLPPNLRQRLEGVYFDIGLLNNLVWLSSEFQRSSVILRAQYLSLSQSIAERLDGIMHEPFSPSNAGDEKTTKV